MSPGGIRRYGVLSDIERHERPLAVLRLTFDELAEPGPAFRDTSAIVPIESVRSGDLQVLAARGLRVTEERTIDLDVLADYPTVASVVASTLVQATRTLPHVSE